MSTISSSTTSTTAYKVTADTTGTLVIQTGATPTTAVTVDASQNVGIGTSSPSARLNIVDATSQDALRITQTGTGNALVVEDSANPDSTPFVIDASGKVLVATTTPKTTGVGSAVMQIFGGTDPLSFYREADSTTPINLEFAKARAAGAILASGDTIGRLYFSGSDGAAQIPAAYIDAAVDGTPGTNDMPGRLIFRTTADGASSPTEAMRINSAQNVSIGTSAAAAGTTLRLSKAITGAVASYGVLYNGAVQSDVTSQANYFTSTTSTAAAAFTLVSLRHYLATQSTIGAGSTVTNQYGFAVANTLIGATNNYGFYGDIASGTGRYNFYANGTANNYFAGNVGIGTSSPTEQLQITGNFKIGSAVQSTPSGSAPLFSARAWVNFNGTGTVAIRASGNVTSITDNGTGNYTVNFTNAMPDANYSFVASCGNNDNNGMMASPQSPTFATGSARFVTRYHDNGAADSLMTLVAVFR